MKTAKCKGCGARIIWAETPAGNMVPLNYTRVRGYQVQPFDDGSNLSHSAGLFYISHFTTCPQVAKFSARKGKGGDVARMILFALLLVVGGCSGESGAKKERCVPGDERCHGDQLQRCFDTTDEPFYPGPLDALENEWRTIRVCRDGCEETRGDASCTP